jgi:apolipoprotein N-acyltransferase
MTFWVRAWRNVFVWYATAGTLLGAAFLHSLLWPLAVLGLVLWCAALERTNRVRDALIGGLLTGTIKVLFAISWYWAAYPLSWMNIHPLFIVALIIGLYWLLTSVTIGLGFAISTALAWWCRKNISPQLHFFILPLLVVAGEVLGSLIFSIYALGPGSTINANFSFGYVGYLLNNHEILRLGALFGGVYTLSYVLGFIAVGIYSAFVTRRRVMGAAAIFVFVAIVASAPLHVPAPTPSSVFHTRVALISSDFLPEASPNPIEVEKKRGLLRKAVEEAFAYNPEYILLPEAAGLTVGSDTPTTLAWLTEKGRRAVLIDSARVDLDNGTARVRAFIYDPATSNVYETDKQYLVPQGEYVPYVYEFLFSALGTKDFYKDRTDTLAYRPGIQDENNTTPGDMPAVIFCSESIPPLSVFGMAKQRDIPFVVHPVSHSWFNTPWVLWAETRDMVALQALQNGVPVVQAGNLAPTIGFDSRGHEIRPFARHNDIHTSVVVYDL